MRRFILLFLCISGKAIASEVDTLPGLRISNAGAASDRIVFRCCTTMTDANRPLYVLDGTPVDSLDLSKINPNDILHIDILKATDATALYGCRAMNGVIIITTRRSNHLIIVEANNKTVLPGATINIQSNKNPRQSFGFVADEKGEIDLGSINLIDQPDQYSIEVSCIGYQTRTITISKAISEHVIKMEKKYKSMDTVLITSNESLTRRIRCFCGFTRIVGFTQQKQESMQKLFSLYPNPVSSAGTVTLNLKKAVFGTADLINSAGQIVQTILLSEENTNPVIHLRNAMSGCYFVRIKDSKSQTAISQKLIVQ